MIETILLTFYFIISVTGIYAAINYCNKDMEYKKHTASSIVLCILLIISFSVIYIKQIIQSYFILWFIFDTFFGIVYTIRDRNKTSITITPFRCVSGVITGIISCAGVLYILL